MPKLKITTCAWCVILQLCFFAGISYAQKNSVVNDSLKVNTLIITGKEAARKLEKSGLEGLLTASRICEGKKSSYFIKQQVQALSGIASYYMYKGKYDSSLYYNNRVMKIGTENKDELAVARANLGFGNIANYRADYETSVSKNLLALKYFESVRDTLGIAAAMGNIGWSYVRLNQFQKAVQFLNKSIELYLKKGQVVPAANNMSNLSGAYKGLRNPQKEMELKLKAFNLFQSQNYKKGMATVATNLGIFYEESSLDEALKYYNIALKCSWQINDNGNIATLYNNLSDLYLRLNRVKEAETSVDSAWYFALKSGDRLAQADAMLYKANILHAQGKHIESAGYTNRYIRIRDSIYAGKMQNQVADMEVKYETEKKQKQIELLNQYNTIQALKLKQSGLEITEAHLEIEKNKLYTANQGLQLKDKQNQLHKKQLESQTRGQKITLLKKQNTIQQLQIAKRNMTIMVIAGIFMLFIIIGYLFYNRYRLKQEAHLQKAIIHQQELATKGIIEAEERERKRIAGDLHDGVGQLVSAVKMNLDVLISRYLIKQPDADMLAERTMLMVDESCTEVRSIAHQMMPNALIRSGLVSALRDFLNKIPSDKLKISVQTDGLNERLDGNTETVLYRVIQESVNNAIKHANASNLDIMLISDHNEVTVTIEDNGKGFIVADKKDYEGIGLKNIITRVEYLRGTVDISSAPGKGTLVAIHIPVV